MSTRYIFKKRGKRILAAVIDFIGGILFFPFRIFASTQIPKKVKSILVMRLDHIGDVFYATGIPHNLKLNYPDARVIFLTGSWAQGLLERNPYIDEIICWDAPWFDRKNNKSNVFRESLDLMIKLRSYDFDLGFDLRGDARHILIMFFSKIKYRVSYGISAGRFLLNQCVPYAWESQALDKNLALLEGVHLRVGHRLPEVCDTFSGDSKFERIFSENKIEGETRLAVIHPFSGTTAKNWISGRFIQLADTLAQEYGVLPVFIGSKADYQAAGEMVRACKTKACNVAGVVSLGSLCALFKKAKLFVGVDSGPSHIAAYSGIPTAVLYSGTNNAFSWAPKGNNVAVIQSQVACGGCEKEECSDNVCMSGISVQDVLRGVAQAMKGIELS